MSVERILVVFNEDGSVKGIASYAVNGAAEPMTEEAAAALLPHADLLAQVQALQAREKANEKRATDAEADRDAKVAAAEAEKASAIAAAETDRGAKIAEAEGGRTAAEAALAGRDETIATLEARIAELTAPPASIIVSDRQLFQALAIGGKITEAEAEAAVATGTIPAEMLALVDQLPADQQFTARMLLKGETTFRSDHPVADMLAGLYGLTEEQKLDLFQVASQL
ncbi:MAG: hypothetical protein FD152_2109 [Xanthobacteraceae bacterium]|nr:MAG: hypothetical protein FD152_2109 [Xanthobacteraceae bacterium]